MNHELLTRSKKIKLAYTQKNISDGKKNWLVQDYMAGFVKDVGDLSKLIMVKNNLRESEGDLDNKLKHEIGDCLWSIFAICEELNIEPDDALTFTLNELEKRLGL